MRPRLPILGVLLVALLGGACATSDPTDSGTARVRVLLTDAPIDLSAVSAVNVTFTEFTLWPVQTATDGEIVMGMPGGGSDTVNLLDYQGGQVTLVASAEVPPGNYQRIRLSISSAELARDDDGDPATPDLVEPIVVPSGKVDVPVAFSVEAGENLEITLDFDAEQSVQVNATAGNPEYLLRPVIVPVGMRRL